MGLISAIMNMFSSRQPSSYNTSTILDVGNTDPVCPYCGADLEKMPGRKTKCPSCGDFIYVRTRPSDKKKILIKEDEILVVEEQWAIANGVHEQFLAEREAYSNERKKLARKFRKEPSKNDIRWSLLNRELLMHAQNYHWGLYRNAKLSMGDILKAESKDSEALDMYFEVCYLDLNGPNNCGTLDPEILKKYPPFNPKEAFLAPAVLGCIAKIVSSLCIDEPRVEDKFFKAAERLHKSLTLPVCPDKAWKALKNDLYGA